ncbi:phage tail assembly chaperone [Burkholderia singularis]|uniref:Phage tail assembly chaperone n=1 Tax=Burkholderia singularis TaxID=1503053 RepID=A0A238H4Z1_9BURK|nr:phage tail assembly chaperone [Burkholderia singularis]SMG00332.1 Phage tail assembly chaperone [Burkholderia singularis]
MENGNHETTDLRAAALNPLTGWRHEELQVPEWGGVTVAVREPTLDDRLFWVGPLNDAAAVADGDDEEAVRSKYRKVGVSAHTFANARLFVRVLFERTPAGWRRLFADEDVPAVVTAFGAVHEQIVVKAIQLGKLDVDPVEDGKKPSAETQASDS